MNRSASSHDAAMELGRAWSRVAAISRLMGDAKKADDASVQAVTVYEAERRARPDDAEVAAALARALGDLALVRADAGQNGPAEEHYRRATVLDAEAAQRQPSNAAWRARSLAFP